MVYAILVGHNDAHFCEITANLGPIKDIFILALVAFLFDKAVFVQS